MKVGFCSDIHLDVNSMYLGKNILPDFISFLKTKNLDILIISGDVSNFMEDSLKIIDVIEKNVGIKVLFIPGNHDIWVNQKESSWNSYHLASQHHSTLINQSYNLNDDLVVIGDMGWYDYSFAPDTIPYYKIKSRKKSLWVDSDYALWDDDSDSDVLNKVLNNLTTQLEHHKHKQVIFVNHFIPYKDFVVTKSSDNNWNLCNAFMGSEKIGQLIDKYPNIKYITFGHTHKRFGHVEFKNKQVICKPLGYLGEWKTDDIQKEFNDSFTIINL